MTPSLDVDLFSDDVLASPWELHGRIREMAPAVWLPQHNVWATGRDAIVRDILVDSARFSSRFGVGLYDTRRSGVWKPSAILELDPPDHDAPRALMNRLLSPRALREMRNDFEVTARALVDDVIEMQTFDGIADLALGFPLTVLTDLVGLRDDGRDHLAIYNRMYFNSRVPGNPRSLASIAEVEESGSGEWIREQCRREHLAPGKFGHKLYDAADAGEISHETAEGLVRTFLGASIDTTVLALGTMLHQLALQPAAWRVLRDDPSQLRNAFDETLRWAPPAALIGRTTTEPVDLDGVRLDSDEKIVCLMTAASRDPRFWDNPDAFDIERKAGPQLAFGIGRHFCVGHALARLEADVLLTELLGRVETLELAGEPEPDTVNWLLGLKALPLRVT